ncbi:MAG TPA: anhydro-N-acetylmuramic acid kinase [Kosmotogaceae bacterium]|nr:anhydro-N-acetylmuramic acid kinase [Kosmotogaceae bacterium]
MNWREICTLADKAERIVAGVMSGTSADGLDVAICRCNGSSGSMVVELLCFDSYSYTETFRDKMIKTYDRKLSTVEKINYMNFEIARVHSQMILDSIQKSGLPIDIIGYHGQTVYHDPDRGATLQLGEADVISTITELPVVYGFRSKDVSLGGQGAPLIPYLDWILFEPGTVTVNIGGISNITVLGKTLDETTAFDTGPGNCLLDITTQKYFREPYDHDGKLSARGVVNKELLTLLRERNRSFSEKPPPKSTGREVYNEEFLARIESYPPHDVMRTLVAFTVGELWSHINRYATAVNRIVVTGGGAYNKTMMSELDQLADCEVFVPEDRLIESREAMGMAVLAHEFFNGTPSNVPHATGASRAAILGKLSLP